MNKNQGIYQILCLINKKAYYGSTVDFSRRFQDHKLTLRKKEHYNQYLQNAWNKIKNRRCCIITKPDGEEVWTDNLTEFCRDNNLLEPGMRAVIIGISRHHHGWHCRSDSISMEEWENNIYAKRGGVCQQDHGC